MVAFVRQGYDGEGKEAWASPAEICAAPRNNTRVAADNIFLRCLSKTISPRLLQRCTIAAVSADPAFFKKISFSMWVLCPPTTLFLYPFFCGVIVICG